MLAYGRVFDQCTAVIAEQHYEKQRGQELPFQRTEVQGRVVAEDDAVALDLEAYARALLQNRAATGRIDR